jgi:hypothetical protein
VDRSECINWVESIIGGLFAPVVVFAVLGALQAGTGQVRRAPAGGDFDDDEPPPPPGGGAPDFFRSAVSPRLWWLRILACLAVAVIAWLVHLAAGSGSVGDVAGATAIGAVGLLGGAVLQGAPSG